MLRYIFFSFMLVAGCQDKLIGEAEHAVRDRLNDPYSAQFENVERCEKPNAVRGQVNAKNAFGAYTGKQAFYYVDGKAVLSSDHLSFDEWDQASRGCFSDEMSNEFDAHMKGLTDSEKNEILD